MKWSGLIRKLLYGIIFTEVLMLTILVYNSVRLLNSTHAQLFERTVNEEVTLMSSLLLGGLSVRDRALIHENLQLFSKQKNVTYAIVYDRQMRMMAQVGEEPGKFNIDTNFTQAQNDGIYDTENKIELGGQLFGYLRAGFSVEEIRILSDKAKLQNTIIAITAIILSIVATILVGNYLIRRISFLQQGARELQQGNYLYRLALNETDELGELALAYNQLGDSLSKSKNELLDKQAEIEQKAARFSDLLNSVNAVIIEATLEPFNIHFINKEAENLLGYFLEDWYHSSFLLDIVHPDDATIIKGFLDRPDVEENATLDYRVSKKNGEEVWLRQITNIHGNGEEASANIILFDITKERKNAEVERSRDIALAENRTKNIFLANMSHELRTPLNAIIGYSELLQEELEQEVDKESTGEDLRRITQSANHLLELINDILDISKINAGKLELKISQLSMEHLLKEIADMIVPLAEKNNNRLNVVLDENFSIYTDKQRIYQVLVNLAGNACKFTQNGDIHIIVYKENNNNNFTIEIRDTGIGIKQEDLNNLFKEFSRTKNVSTIEGTGLGLCLSEKLCRIMGGNISVSSIYKVGSVFKVTLPISKSEGSFKSRAQGQT